MPIFHPNVARFALLLLGMGAPAVGQASWQIAYPQQSPVPDYAWATAFDEVHGEAILMFPELQSNQGWRWDGSAWSQLGGPLPPNRYGCYMVWDVVRQRVVLFGGRAGLQFLQDLWEWDGGQWHASVPNSPGAWSNSAGWYDSQRNEIGIHGGTSFHSGTMNQTWIYRTANGATSTPFGSGCVGSSGVPLLENVPYSLPWIGDTFSNRVSVAPGELGALFVPSFSQNALPMSLSAVGMPGCDLLLPLDVVEFRSALTGVAQWSLSIPNSATFVGVPIYQQAFPFDAAANALGLVSSNGLVMTPGIR